MAKDPKNSKQFFKSFKAELKKVTWPTPKQIVNNTSAVITIVLIIAAIVFVLDLTFDSMNKYGLDKIKAAVQSTNTTADQNDVNTAEDANTADAASTDNTSVDNAAGDISSDVNSVTNTD